MTTPNTPLAGTFTFQGTDSTVHRMGYGAMQLAGKGVFGPPRDHDEAIAVLREVIDAGVNHIDTSDFYGPHVTNRLIAEALHPYPDNLVLVTKLGARRPADGSWQPAIRPDELTAGLHDNLRHLKLDAMDVVNYRHMGEGHGPSQGTIAPQVETLARLKEQGLIKHIGLSNVTPEQLVEAQSITDIVCVQNLYNLVQRSDEAWLDDLARQGIAYVPFFPLGGFTPIQSALLGELAAQLEVTPMQLALAWLLHRSPNILLIPGTSSRAHLRENLAAAALQLSPQLLERLDHVAAEASPSAH